MKRRLLYGGKGVIKKNKIKIEKVPSLIKLKMHKPPKIAQTQTLLPLFFNTIHKTQLNYLYSTFQTDMRPKALQTQQHKNTYNKEAISEYNKYEKNVKTNQYTFKN